jgi:hypothetical protein
MGPKRGTNNMNRPCLTPMSCKNCIDMNKKCLPKSANEIKCSAWAPAVNEDCINCNEHKKCNYYNR